MDSVTEVSRVGWGSRLLDAIKGSLFGPLLFAVSFPLLFWNEGRAVRRARDLVEGRDAVVEARAATVNPAQEGRLVHVTGDAVTAEVLRDAELGSAAQGVLRMRRVVEMYQWHEERRSRSSSNTGGSQTQTTTYTYRLAWSSTPVDSSRFHVVDEHVNSPIPLQSTSVEAQHATLGARTLTPALVSQVRAFRPRGVLLIARPLVVVADVLPLFGSLVGAGVGLAAFAIASPFSLVTVAVARIAYRPLIGAALLAVGVAIAVLAGKFTSDRGRAKNASRAALRAA